MKKALLALLIAGSIHPNSTWAQFAESSTMEYWNVQPLQQFYVLPPNKRGIPLQMTPELPTNAIEPVPATSDATASGKVFFARPETPVNVNPNTSPEYEAKVAEMEAHNRKLREEWLQTQQRLYF